MKEEIKNYLLKLVDKKYLEFSNKITKIDNHKIGVKIPILRDYAKKLLKNNNLKTLIANIDEEYYEEVMLKGILIGLDKKLSLEELLIYIKYYIPKINDWSLCDIFVSGLKITKKYQKELWSVIKEYLNSKEEFMVRFALVMILNYYLNDEYLDEVYHLINRKMIPKYYVQMGQAWLLSYLIIEDYDRALVFLKKCRIDTWTYNKGITKAIESYRLSDTQKDDLKKLRKTK